MALVQKVIVALRNIRTERNIPSATRVNALLAVADDYKKTILEGYKTIIAEQGRCAEVRVRRSGASFSGEYQLSKMAMTMAGDVEVMVPLEGLVDTKDEIAKLDKEKSKLEKRRDDLKRKLTDPKFVDRAPLEVVDKARAELAELEAALAKIADGLRRLAGG